MDNSKAFLLKKIIGYKENGLETLGNLHAKHVDDISKVMLEFATASMIETIERLNRGEDVNFNGHLLSFKKQKARKS